jgi:hypothetical protein
MTPGGALSFRRQRAVSETVSAEIAEFLTQNRAQCMNRLMIIVHIIFDTQPRSTSLVKELNVFEYPT